MLLNEPRLTRIAEREGLQGLVATSPENVTYSSGYWALSQWIRRGPQTYVLLTAEDLAQSHLIAATSLLDLVADQGIALAHIHRFGFFHTDRAATLTEDLDRRQHALYALPEHRSALEALVGAIRAAGLGRAAIGVDELGLLPGHWEALEDALPDATLVPAARLFREIRAVKTPEEIERLRTVAQITERSIAAALDAVGDGATELDLARAFHARTVEEDAFPVLGCIGFGTRSAMPNVQPSDRRISRGDVIRFDVGGRYRHYRADIARNAVYGSPDDRVGRYYEALHAGVAGALAMIRPGVAAAEVYHACMATVRGRGIPHYQRSHVGHGIGIDGYDLPDLSPGSQDVIEEGMVLCVETPFYELGWCGLQVEDMVVVRAGGVETLMTTDGTLQVVS